LDWNWASFFFGRGGRAAARFHPAVVVTVAIPGIVITVTLLLPSHITLSTVVGIQHRPVSHIVRHVRRPDSAPRSDVPGHGHHRPFPVATVGEREEVTAEDGIHPLVPHVRPKRRRSSIFLDRRAFDGIHLAHHRQSHFSARQRKLVVARLARRRRLGRDGVTRRRPSHGLARRFGGEEEQFGFGIDPKASADGGHRGVGDGDGRHFRANALAIIVASLIRCGLRCNSRATRVVGTPTGEFRSAPSYFNFAMKARFSRKRTGGRFAQGILADGSWSTVVGRCFSDSDAIDFLLSGIDCDAGTTVRMRVRIVAFVSYLGQ